MTIQIAPKNATGRPIENWFHNVLKLLYERFFSLYIHVSIATQRLFQTKTLLRIDISIEGRFVYPLIS